MKGTQSFFKLISGLTGNGSKLVIDEYQRHYVWTKERAVNLVKTIIAADDKTFIGTITIYSPDSTEVQVVDGQQRLVTIYITMKVLRDIMSANRELYDEILRSAGRTVQHLERAYDDLIDDKYSGEFKLSFRKKATEDDFDAVIRKGKQPKYKGSQIEKNYNAIKAYLLECAPEDLCKAYLHLLDTVECIPMECDNQVEAYRTFASINGLGQKVEDKYSIINIIFQHLGSANKDVCNLIEDEDKSFMNRFLFHKTGKWVSRKEIVPAFTNYIEGKNPMSVVDDILSFGQFDVQSQEYIKQNYLMPLPTMLIVVDHFRSLCLSEECVRESTKYFSSVFMRMQVCPGPNHVREDDIAAILLKVRNVRDAEQFINFEDNTGRLYYPDDETFKKSLIKCEVYRSPVLKNFILQAINNEISDYERFDARDISVEHIAPQRDNRDNPLLHTIGNLTLTDSCKNSTMGAKDFQTKKEVLTHSVYAINKYFEDVDEWNDEQILKRGEYLADIAVKIWSI